MSIAINRSYIYEDNIDIIDIRETEATYFEVYIFIKP